jgi:Zn ribbon nucleic-acid-binding protein
METQFLSDGHCPQCSQKNMKSVFQENSTRGYWECPTCNLQLQMLAPNHLGILNERGAGQLKSTIYDKNIWGERVLLRRPMFKGDDCVIKNLDELNHYLATF